ncbi:MAG: FAD-dependent oxidoreductase, partial [Actinomycetota bacterium]
MRKRRKPGVSRETPDNMMPPEHCLEYDIVIIGAGHAGCEAALAAARLGCRTALVTLSENHLAHLPCNPSIGGIGKGQLVREIDALGGEMGRLTDRAALQIKRLNGSKGPAVQALRAQVDKLWYPRLMHRALAAEDNLDLLIGEAAKLFVRKGRLAGIGLVDGRKLTARAAILTTGTFLRGSLTLGARTWPGGRTGESAAVRLAKTLGDIGFELSRFQTATPPRVHRGSVDFAALRVEPGSSEPLRFSFVSPPAQPLQIPCHLTYTTAETRDVVRQHLPRSPIKSGAVTEHGPRNCPSIDRKVLNFPDKTAHPVFVEPESLASDEMYLQGLTTAMPADAQEAIIRTVPGLEGAAITRYGYAVSYDYLPPNQLTLTLETKLVKGLFAAGQINGTT